MLCSVIDKTRQNELNKIARDNRKLAHRSRYLWLHRRYNLNENKRARLGLAQQVLPETSLCWAMKELARELWYRPYGEHSKSYWLEWVAMAKQVGIPLLSSAANSIYKRLYGILNAMKHKVSNGNAESLNSKIRLLRIKARGYQNQERFKTAVMFHYGNLNMGF